MRRFRFTLATAGVNLVVGGLVFDFFNTLVRIGRDTERFAKILTDMGYPCSEDIEQKWSSDTFDGRETPAAEEYDRWRLDNIANLVREVGVPGRRESEVIDLLLRADREWTASLRTQLREHGVLSVGSTPVAFARLHDFVRETLERQSVIGGAMEARIVRERIAAVATAFHSKAGTLTPGVESAISRLRLPTTTLLGVAHQPNLMAGLNVVGLVTLLEATRDALPAVSVALVVLIDYDSAQDARFRSASLPAPVGQGRGRTPGAVAPDHRHRVALAVPSPPEQAIHLWSDRLATSVSSWARCLRPGGVLLRERDDIEALGREMAAEYLNVMLEHQLLVEATSILWSRLINRSWGLDTVVVRASEIVFALGEELVDLVKHPEWPWSDFNADRKVWWICPTCLTRCACRIEHPRQCVSSCTRCAQSISMPLTFRATYERESVHVPVFVPRVEVCESLDYDMIGFSGTASYAGGIEHIFATAASRQRDGRRLVPQLVWDPHDLFSSVSESLIINRGGAREAFEAFQQGKFPAAWYTALMSYETIRDAILHSV